MVLVRTDAAKDVNSLKMCLAQSMFALEKNVFVALNVHLFFGSCPTQSSHHIKYSIGNFGFL